MTSRLPRMGGSIKLLATMGNSAELRDLNDSSLPRRRLHDALFVENARAVGAGDPRRCRRDVALEQNDGLFRLLGNLDELAAAPDSFQIHTDHPRRLVLEKNRQQIDLIHVELVADACQPRKADAFRLQKSLNGRRHRAALHDEPDSVEQGIFSGLLAEARAKAGGIVPDSLAIGPQKTHAVLPSDLEELPVQRRPLFGVLAESRAGDRRVAHSFLTAFLEDGRHLQCRNRDDG